jgi:hypothetical protein
MPEQREALERLIRTHSTPQQITLRARIIVQAADGMGVRASARELDVDTALVDSLKALDPNRPIREADIAGGPE